ncbi:hypothetical protein SAMN02745146_3224 [Hymenobacter daecheongensis DSM 21074]|uniref:Aspartyl protease n=1 Tax=Hymenobacter daecheongensis DSM 21074 TaxID=1121955 RepID=A0A1M6JQG5_9BACT|nr:hypothetical protein [Hymenobacter daecheongensis]SHJ48833.1 hypothetical protein SAMN02745146_3224 [Hymenobacter daecheongensis DSM 21074]
MKRLPKILLTLLALFVLSSIGGYFYFRKKFQAPANQLVVTGLPGTTPFVWKADSSTTPVTAQAALLLPVRLPGCPRTCYLQFDTGAPTSLLYANPLAALRTRYPATRAALLVQADTLHNFTFALGAGKVRARRLRVIRHGLSELPADTTRPLIIGTLGADVLDGRALALDFARRQFSLYDSLPAALARPATFAPLLFAERRVQFTTTVQGQPKQLLFDSGSSAFALLTSKTIFGELARPGAPVKQAAVNSLNRVLTSYTAPTAATVAVGAVAVPLGTVTHIEGTSFVERNLMRFSGMGGMLGNAPFLDRTLILDVRGGRFGVLR